MTYPTLNHPSTVLLAQHSTRRTESATVTFELEEQYVSVTTKVGCVECILSYAQVKELFRLVTLA